MNEPIQGDDLFSEFPSESELASASSTPSLMSRDCESPVPPSPRQAKRTTSLIFEIVPVAPISDRTAAVAPPPSAGHHQSRPSPLRPSLIRRGIAGGARVIGRIALAAKMACVVMVVVGLVVVSRAARVISAALGAGRQMLLRVGSRARVLIDHLLVAVRRVYMALNKRAPSAAATNSTLVPAFRSRILRPAFPPVAAAFVSGLMVGALAMARTPNAVGREAAPVDAGRIVTEELPVSSVTRAGPPAMTPTLSPAVPIATTGTPPPALLTETDDRESSVEDAPDKPDISPRVAASPRAAAPQRARFLGTLTVRSRPAGASVFINGRRVGTTPLVLSDQTVGSRSVRVTLDGHEVWSTAARVVADKQSVVQADLRRLTTAPAAQ